MVSRAGSPRYWPIQVRRHARCGDSPIHGTVPYLPDIRMIVIAFHPAELDAIVRMIRRYTYPKGEAISDRTYNAGSWSLSLKIAWPQADNKRQ